MSNFLTSLFSLFRLNTRPPQSKRPRAKHLAVQQLSAILALAATRYDQMVAGPLSFRHRRTARKFRLSPRRAQVPASFLRNQVFFPDPWWTPLEPERDISEESPIGRRPDGSELLSRTEHSLTLLDGRTVTQERLTIRTPDGRRKKIFTAVFGDGRRAVFDKIPHHLLPLYDAGGEAGAGKSVVLTEGIPAAEALASRGIRTMATLTGGLGTPSKGALQPLTQFARIVLWPDNDSTGVRHMERTARRLTQLGAKDIRILRWIGAPRKADAANFRGSDAELGQLIESATRWSLETPASHRGVLAVNPPRSAFQLRLPAQDQPPVLDSRPLPAVAGQAQLIRLLRVLRPFIERINSGAELTAEETNRMGVLLQRIENAISGHQGGESHAQ